MIEKMVCKLAIVKTGLGNTCCNSFFILCGTDDEECLITNNQLKHPVQCVENSEGQDAVMVFDSESFPHKHHFVGQPKVPVQCMDNPGGEDGVVLFDHQSFPGPLRSRDL